MQKKEDTPRRLSRRKYEVHRKSEGACFQTRLPEKDYAEICDFLKTYQFTKVDLIYAGYCYLKLQEVKG